ncbi:F-box only protein 28 [Fopius arisanus]|uniref:F-box only protein 28 n=2 Tax=Fopius arisanus TaxID=64838 RepID=A0A9R1T488_9HYME|nr:PREDICTED: F-box only protein 28 [Fopius arisanus]
MMEIEMVQNISLIELPDVVLETILSNLSYDELARLRIVCKHFDRTCQQMLNRGFSLMEKYHGQCLKNVKSQLPRRESERRNHALARHADVLTAIETRISMLSMTFMKYVNLHLCCFIPGKVIDEILRVLRLIKDTKFPPRAHEILQELRDISSMAMEHFDEKILPVLKQSACTSMVNAVSSYELPGSSFMISHHNSTPTTSVYGQHTLTAENWNNTMRAVFIKTRKNRLSFLNVEAAMKKLRLRLKRQACFIHLQSKKLQNQSKKIHEQEQQISEMRRHFEEWEQKIGDLTAELSRSREEPLKGEKIESCKRKRIDVIKRTSDNNDLEAKKRKLIVERKPSIDPKDAKFKEYIKSQLLDK